MDRNLHGISTQIFSQVLKVIVPVQGKIKTYTKCIMSTSHKKCDLLANRWTHKEKTLSLN